MREGYIIAISLFIAFALTLLPMPVWAMWMRPAWVLLVLIYWNIADPENIGLGMAWFMGILLDVLNGSLLGEHALAMTMTSYFVVKMHIRIKMFSLLQQILCILLFVFLYQLIIYCVQGFIGELPRSKLYWMSSLISMLLWPCVVTLIRNMRHRNQSRLT
jgi:rod shape-determining protein MreD